MNRYFDLAWMGGKYKVGIHWHSLDKYVNRLIDEGWKIVVVD